MATIKHGNGTLGLGALSKDSGLHKVEIGRPATGPNDVAVDIQFCGMCHSDLHATNGEWGIESFPLIPGHEIAGVVREVGSKVTKFQVGDRVGVGCFVESCSTCVECKRGEQNICRNGCCQTYSSMYPEGKGHDECAGYHTNGGYSSNITVRDEFVLKLPDNLESHAAAPLLCAGITMFSPLNRHVLKGGKTRVGVVGFGGLGQTGVKIAKAMGCEVTVFSRSNSKKEAAEKLGAKLVAHSDEEALKAAANSLEVILDTVAVPHDVNPIMACLEPAGAYVCIGAIPQAMEISPFALIVKNLQLEGSLVGGIPETQQMLEFCSKHNIAPDYKVIKASEANAQFKALQDGTAAIGRAVIDMSTLKDVMLTTESTNDPRVR